MSRTYSDSKILVEENRRGFLDPETQKRALSCLESALDWAHDTGECHFCSYDSGLAPHGEDCPLFGLP
jgi:hypothetical protein